MLTNCLAECAHLTITVSQTDRDIGRKSSFFQTPLHSTPLLGGSRRNSATPFGMEKLEWLGYHKVKKFRRYLYSFWRNSRTWQTDGHRVTAIAALCIASHGKNRPILMKFGTLHQILNPVTVMWPKIEIFKIQHGGGRLLENRFFGHKSSTNCPISAKFCTRKQNGMLTRATGQNANV